MSRIMSLAAVLLISLLPGAASAGLLAPNALTTAPLGSSAPAARIGYVDVRTVATECDAGKAARDQLKTQADQAQAKIKEKEKQLEKMKSAIEAKVATMSQEKLKAKANEFQKKLDAYKEFVQKSEKELMAKEEELTEKILGTVVDVIRDYGKKSGYALIVAKKDLIYAGEGVVPQDLTAEMVTLVNESGKK